MEVDLLIFGNPVRKRNLRFLEVLADKKFGKQSGSVEAKLQTFRSPGRAEVRTLNVISLAVKAGRKCRSGTSHLRKNWQSRNAKRNSCHIMGSQGRAEMRKWNFTSLVVNAVWKRDVRSLAVNAERKCGNGTSDL